MAAAVVFIPALFCARSTAKNSADSLKRECSGGSGVGRVKFAGAAHSPEWDRIKRPAEPFFRIRPPNESSGTRFCTCSPIRFCENSGPLIMVTIRKKRGTRVGEP